MYSLRNTIKGKNIQINLFNSFKYLKINSSFNLTILIHQKINANFNEVNADKHVDEHVFKYLLTHEINIFFVEHTKRIFY